MKTEDRIKARMLREKGFSLKQIAASLFVSKGSVSAWVRDIELSQDALVSINNRLQLGRENSRRSRLSNIAHKNFELNVKCKEEILPFSYRDLWIAGLMLYAGEGSKPSGVSSQHIEITNSDPDILRVFINFLTSICSVPRGKIKVRLMLYQDISQEEAQKYWANELNITRNQFQKSFIKNSYKDSPNRHARRSKFGTAHINVYDVKIYRRLMGWLKAIYEYTNLDFKKSGE